MEDKLKNGISEKGFHYPIQYETMSVETALSYLDLARDGHGLLFEPDNFNGFLALLVLKCGVDIDYAFSASFKLDADEIKKHMSVSKLTMEELEKEVNNRINEIQQREKKRASISSAKERYNNLNAIKRALLVIKQKNPKDSFFDKKSIEEIDKLYTLSPKKR